MGGLEGTAGRRVGLARGGKEQGICLSRRGPERGGSPQSLRGYSDGASVTLSDRPRPWSILRRRGSGSANIGITLAAVLRTDPRPAKKQGG